MNLLLYLLFISLFILDFLALRTGAVPKALNYIPEILSAIAFLVVCAHIAKNRIFFIPARYIIFFALFIIFLIIGILANHVQPGAIFSGIRKYFRYAPFFLLPFVYRFSDKEISKIVKVLLIFSLLQLPVVIYQKLVVFKLRSTGDVIEGTILGSGKLAVFLICSITIVLAYFLKGRISLSKTLLLIFLLFLPVAITEAAAGLFLLPLAFAIPAILMSGNQNRIRSLVPSILIGATFFFGFVAIYNIQYGSRWDGSVMNIIFSEKGMESLYKGANEESTANIPGHARREIGRVDSILLPIKILSKEGVTVLYGVGIGNASPSFARPLSGEYSWVDKEYGAGFTTLSSLLWEMGIIGVLFSYTFLIMVFRDSMKLRHAQDNYGAFALGWLGVISVIALSMVYTNLLSHNVIGFLLWFFCGCVIARTNLINVLSK